MAAAALRRCARLRHSSLSLHWRALSTNAASDTSFASGESVLVLNSGSSSLKYALFNLGESQTKDSLRCAMQGVVERIGQPQGSVTHKTLLSANGNTQKTTLPLHFADYHTALQKVLELLGPVCVRAVGHRVVHGGAAVSSAVLINADVKRVIEEAAAFAPLHNPPNLQAIKTAELLFSCPQVAVFDTAFHATMPPAAYTYAIPRRLIEEHGIRRYGFHGTSYAYLTEQAARYLKVPQHKLNAIAFHLGAGASACAIKEGKSIDTSMGMTPLEGLVMATRSGDIDPAISSYLAARLALQPAGVEAMLLKQSGLLGLCGDADLREVDRQAGGGDKHAQEAIEVMVHRIRKYLGAYLVGLEGRVHTLIFSAGMGENSAMLRQEVCRNLYAFGIVLDAKKNRTVKPGMIQEIQATSSHVKILVLPTNEELSIAQQTLGVLKET